MKYLKHSRGKVKKYISQLTTSILTFQIALDDAKVYTKFGQKIREFNKNLHTLYCISFIEARQEY